MRNTALPRSPACCIKMRRPVPARSSAVNRAVESVPRELSPARIAAAVSFVPAQAHRMLAAEHRAQRQHDSTPPTLPRLAAGCGRVWAAGCFRGMARGPPAQPLRIRASWRRARRGRSQARGRWSPPCGATVDSGERQASAGRVMPVPAWSRWRCHAGA
jgi:hypothetical protein